MSESLLLWFISTLFFLVVFCLIGKLRTVFKNDLDNNDIIHMICNISYATYWPTCSWKEIEELESSMLKSMQLEMHIQISQPKTFQVLYFSNYTFQSHSQHIICDIHVYMHHIYHIISCIPVYVRFQP